MSRGPSDREILVGARGKDGILPGSGQDRGSLMLDFSNGDLLFFFFLPVLCFDLH